MSGCPVGCGDWAALTAREEAARGSGFSAAIRPTPLD